MVNYKIELSPVEAAVVKQLIYSELQTYRDRQDHAASHGQTFLTVHSDGLQTLIEKIEFAILADN